jgi:hypothetical protein
MNRSVRFAKKTPRRPLVRKRRGSLAVPAWVRGEEGTAVTGARDDLPMKSIGEIAAAIVERLAAQKRDA